LQIGRAKRLVQALVGLELKLLGLWRVVQMGLCASQFSFIGGVYTLAAAHYEDYAI